MKKLLVLVAVLTTICSLCSAQSIWVIGDSTAAPKDLSKQTPERGWAMVMQPYFKTLKVENYARNGRSTRTCIAEGIWATVEQAMKQGDILIVQFGHNDAKENSERYSTPEQYGENIAMFVRAALAKGVRPVVMTPVTRRKWVDGELVYTHGDYPAAARRVAAELNVPLVDMEELTRTLEQQMGEEGSKQLHLHIPANTYLSHPDGATDNTHYTIAGARKVARIAVSELDKIFHFGDELRSFDIAVARDGSGDCFSVQQAVDMVPDYTKADRVKIYIAAGDYREKVVVGNTKQNIVLEGQSADSTRIVFGNFASLPDAFGNTLGTSGSATLYIGGTNITLRDLTIENDAGRVGQAVAAHLSGDRIAMFNCRLLGNQDTLYLYGSGNGNTTENRCYFADCYIEGTTDFIFGAATGLFENCTICCKDNSYITAASTPKGKEYGLVFRNCTLEAVEGVTECYLGRPWRDYARTVWIGCTMGSFIRSEGWHNWGKPQAERTVLYAEQGTKGCSTDQRARWSKQLTAKEVAKHYSNEQILNGWAAAE